MVFYPSHAIEYSFGHVARWKEQTHIAYLAKYQMESSHPCRARCCVISARQLTRSTALVPQLQHNYSNIQIKSILHSIFTLQPYATEDLSDAQEKKTGLRDTERYTNKSHTCCDSVTFGSVLIVDDWFNIDESSS